MPRSITSIYTLTLFLILGLLQNASAESIKCGDALKILDIDGQSYEGKLFSIAKNSISLGAKKLAKADISKLYLYRRGRAVPIRNGIAIGLLVGAASAMYAERPKREPGAQLYTYHHPDPWLIAGVTLGCAAVGGMIGALVYGYEQIDKKAFFDEMDCSNRAETRQTTVVRVVIKINL